VGEQAQDVDLAVGQPEGAHGVPAQRGSLAERDRVEAVGAAGNELRRERDVARAELERPDAAAPLACAPALSGAPGQERLGQPDRCAPTAVTTASPATGAISLNDAVS
jgi:hypothetical protein